MNSTFRYVILSAVLAAGPAMAGDFQALGSLSPAALDKAQLARIEGGATVCSVSIAAGVQVTCQLQLADITQANVNSGALAGSQNNSAAIVQEQNASQSD